MPLPANSSPIDQPRLSKSKIASYERCRRKLWLQVYRPHLAEFDEATLALFQCGHYVGELARRQYAQGHLVAEDHFHIPEAIARTKEFIAAGDPLPIFEAAFAYDGVVVRADILEPDHWGGWRLIEVKNSASVKPYQIRDVASQAWVLQASRICISSIFIRHVHRPLRPGTRKPLVHFVDGDVTSDAQRLISGRAAIAAEARSTLAGPEPFVRPGPHCDRPSCEFRRHCFES